MKQFFYACCILLFLMAAYALQSKGLAGWTLFVFLITEDSVFDRDIHVDRREDSSGD